MASQSWDDVKSEHFTDQEQENIRFEAALEGAELALGELRKARGLTQKEMAERMRTSQPQLSKIENSEEYYLSTLKRYVEALGGELEITAKIDGKRVQLNT